MATRLPEVKVTGRRQGGGTVNTYDPDSQGYGLSDLPEGEVQYFDPWEWEELIAVPIDLDITNPEPETDATWGGLIQKLLQGLRLGKYVRITPAGLAASLLAELVIAAAAIYYVNKDDPELQISGKTGQDKLTEALDALDISAAGDALSVNPNQPQGNLNNVEDIHYDPSLFPVPATIGNNVVTIAPTTSGIVLTTTPIVIVELPGATPQPTPVPKKEPGTSTDVDVNIIEIEIPFNNPLTDLPLPIYDVPLHVDLPPGLTDRIDTIPPVEIRVSPELNIEIDVGKNSEDTSKESTRKRKDTKRKSKGVVYYMALLRLVNRSYGTYSELKEMYDNAIDSIILEDIKICRGPKQGGSCIFIRKGQKLSSVPEDYRDIFMAEMLTNSSRLSNKWKFDATNFMLEQLYDEILDHMIGAATKAERKAINKAGIRGLLDYGNLSTWIRRFQKMHDYANPDSKQLLKELAK